MEVFNGFFLILFFAVLTDFCNALEPEEVVDVSQSKALTLKGGQNRTEEAEEEIKVKLRVIGVFRISDRIDTSKYWYKKIQKKLSSKLCKRKIRNPNLFSFFTAKKGRVSFVIPAKHNIITPISRTH